MKHVVYGATRNIYNQVPAAIKSLLDHTDVDCVHLLLEDDEFPEPLPSVVKVLNVREFADWMFPDGSPNADTHWTKMILVRVCYPELFPDVDKVLQLDVDTIVLDDLSPLWDVDMEGKWFAAVPEKYGAYNPWRAPVYHNIGVAMLNLDFMRADHAEEELVDFINNVETSAVEQNAYNYLGAMRGKSVDLPTRYNENKACGFTDDPAIMHYLGWLDKDCDQLPRLEYKRHYRELPWSEVKYARM